MTDIVELVRLQALCDEYARASAVESLKIERLRNENVKVSIHCAELIEQNAELLGVLENIADGCLDCRPYARAAIEKAKT